MTGEETVGGSGTSPARLGIVGALLAIGRGDLLPAAPILDTDIRERHIPDRCTCHARYDDAGQRVAIIGNDVVDINIAGR